MQNGRVFIVGDAAHRHPPSNGLGSNTSIQDSFNLAWKLALAVQGKAGSSLLESFSEERAPIAKQIVTRANQSIAEFGPIFDALGMDGGVDHDKIQRNMDARCDTGQKAEPAFEKDPELHYAPTTWPGARLPHAWVFDSNGARHSTLDITGHGKFTLLTGIGGEAWVEAAKALSADLGVNIATRVIGPRREYEDYTGDWATAREVEDSGCLIVRPDHHVGWRAFTASGTPREDLSRAFETLLGF